MLIASMLPGGREHVCTYYHVTPSFHLRDSAAAVGVTSITQPSGNNLAANA